MDWDTLVVIGPLVAAAARLLADTGVRKVLQGIITRPRDRDALVRVDTANAHAVVLGPTESPVDVDRFVEH